MSTRIVSVVPAGDVEPMFATAEISIVKIDPEPFIPDYEPDPLDLALVRLQEAMFGRDAQSLDMLRDYIDRPPVASRKAVGLSAHGKGTASDVAIAAVLNHPDSVWGVQYAWAADSHPMWPEGLTLVTYRGVLFERDGDTLTRWAR